MLPKKCNRFFSKKVYAEIPVFYQFLRKTTKAENDKIEAADVEKSQSTLHRSVTYLNYETYAPHTKFNISKKMIK